MTRIAINTQSLTPMRAGCFRNFNFPSLGPRRYWLEWESPVHTVIVLIAFVVACQFFEPYMAPIVLLLVFVKYYAVYVWDASKSSGGDDDDNEQQTDEDDQQDDHQPDDQDDEKFKVQFDNMLVLISSRFFVNVRTG